MARNYDREPVCCSICRRQAISVGHTPRSGAPIAWSCDHVDCLTSGHAAYNMSDKAFSLHEKAAITEGGAKAGAFLETLGKFSLAELTSDEYETFLATFLRGFEDDMRARILTHKAPF